MIWQVRCGVQLPAGTLIYIIEFMLSFVSCQQTKLSVEVMKCHVCLVNAALLADFGMQSMASFSRCMLSVDGCEHTKASSFMQKGLSAFKADREKTLQRPLCMVVLTWSHVPDCVPRVNIAMLMRKLYAHDA